MTVVPVDLDLGEPLAEHDGQAVEAGVGHEQVRAPPDDQHVDARAATRPRPRACEVVARRRSATQSAAAPPTR